MGVLGDVTAQKVGQIEKSNVAVVDSGEQKFCLKILQFTHDLHQKHGLRHKDYQRYRSYCSRRLARLRQALKMSQGDKKGRFIKNEVNLQDVCKDERMILIPLMRVERAWALAMQLKFEMNSEPRKRYHMLERLRKAVIEVNKLNTLILKSCKLSIESSDGSKAAVEISTFDAITKLECKAYCAWIKGLGNFEGKRWVKARRFLSEAKNIYEKMSTNMEGGEASIYEERINEIIPSLRYCAYNLESNTDDVLAKNKVDENTDYSSATIDELVSEADKQRSCTLEETEWKGRRMSVKHLKVRRFLQRYFDSQSLIGTSKESNSDGNMEKLIKLYDSLLIDCRDAIQVCRDELNEDGSFRNRNLVNHGPVSSPHFLHTRLLYIKHTMTISRNLLLIHQLVAKYQMQDGKGQTGKPTARNATAGKEVKPQELVRLYETVISNLKELITLPGLEDCQDLLEEVQCKLALYRAHRAKYIAEAVISLERYGDAGAICELSKRHLNAFEQLISQQEKKEKQVLSEDEKKRLCGEGEKLREVLNHLTFSIHPKSFLGRESGLTNDSATLPTMNTSGNYSDDWDKVPLIDRLDVYREVDSFNAKGYKPNLVKFPPPFKPVACKPLFFDLARESIAVPVDDIESRLRELGVSTPSPTASKTSEGGDNTASPRQKGSVDGGRGKDKGQGSWFGGWFSKK